MSTDWKSRHLCGVATPTGTPCTAFEQDSPCTRPGFVETRGLCSEHFEIRVVRPAESLVREAHTRFFQASAAEGCLYASFRCTTCDFTGNAWELNDQHYIQHPDHELVPWRTLKPSKLPIPIRVKDPEVY